MKGSLYNQLNGKFGMVPAFGLHDYGKAIGVNGFAVYAALTIYANGEDGAFPSINTLAEKLDCSPTTVKKNLKNLERLGLIFVKRPDKKGRGFFNRYYIADNPLNSSVDKPTKKGSPHDPFPEKGSPHDRKRGHQVSMNKTIEHKGKRRRVSVDKIQVADPVDIERGQRIADCGQCDLGYVHNDNDTVSPCDCIRDTLHPIQNNETPYAER